VKFLENVVGFALVMYVLILVSSSREKVSPAHMFFQFSREILEISNSISVADTVVE